MNMPTLCHWRTESPLVPSSLNYLPKFKPRSFPRTTCSREGLTWSLVLVLGNWLSVSGVGGRLTGRGQYWSVHSHLLEIKWWLKYGYSFKKKCCLHHFWNIVSPAFYLNTSCVIWSSILDGEDLIDCLGQPIPLQLPKLVYHQEMCTSPPHLPWKRVCVFVEHVLLHLSCLFLSEVIKELDRHQRLVSFWCQNTLQH